MNTNHFSKKRYAVLLLEAQPLLAQGIQQTIEASGKFLVSGVMDDGLKLLSLYKKQAADILILNWTLPGIAGIDLIELLRAKEAKLPVLVLAQQEQPEHFSLYQKGLIQGLLLTSSPVNELIQALNSLVQETPYWGATFEGNTAQAIDPTKVHLSPRERQVLKLVAEGVKNREIATHFSISVKTVESHRLNLMRKLNAHHVVSLVNWARRLQLI